MLRDRFPCDKCGKPGAHHRADSDRWLCTACRAVELVELMRHPKCPQCGESMETSRDIHRSVTRTHCKDCGLHIVADDNGKVTRILTKPPVILCSSCGEPLDRDLDGVFECRPCGRSVTA